MAANPHTALRDHVCALLGESHAHVEFQKAVADWPQADR